MPLNVRRFYTSCFLVLAGFVIFAPSQIVPSDATAMAAPTTIPTSGDVMRDRISRSKAFIAVRNYNAAIYELENIRRETSDTAVQGVVNVLLMNSYLEQGDYKRAQDLLGEFYAAQKTTKANASSAYQAVAGQIVKSARNRVERYRALGLSVSDRTLPLEALNDLEKMRETLELVITQSKEIVGDKAKTPDALVMLEEASSSRTMLARDDYDSRRWKDEVADSREKLAISQSVVTSSTNAESPAEVTLVAENTGPAASPPVPVMQPVVETKPDAAREREVKTEPKTVEKTPSETVVAQVESPLEKPIVVTSAPPTVKPKPKEESKEEIKEETPPVETPQPVEPKDNSPLDIGSQLIDFATSRSNPVYPSAAKIVRSTGIVKVEVTISETGDVAEVQKSSGPPLLQGAARDAIRKWKFTPFRRDGQPVKATGYVNFNFAL